LQLAALSLQRRLAAADTLVISGKQRFIADYLREDVLAPWRRLYASSCSRPASWIGCAARYAMR
jgi:hypothetical protein